MNNPHPARQLARSIDRSALARLEATDPTSPEYHARCAIFHVTRGGGAGRIKAMTGGRATAIDNGFTVRLPMIRRQLTVTLAPSDTYTVTLATYRGRITQQLADVYNDQLATTVENMTQLRFSL